LPSSYGDKHLGNQDAVHLLGEECILPIPLHFFLKKAYLPFMS